MAVAEITIAKIEVRILFRFISPGLFGVFVSKIQILCTSKRKLYKLQIKLEPDSNPVLRYIRVVKIGYPPYQIYPYEFENI